MTRGFFGVGIYHPKFECNVGGLWRSAEAFGASFMYTVGRRYREQAADTSKARRHVPLFHFRDLADLKDHLPDACPLVGVELGEGATPLDRFCHPERCAFLLGAEDHGLPPAALSLCHFRVVVPGASRCLNVATAGSIVLYDRWAKRKGAAGDAGFAVD